MNRTLLVLGAGGHGRVVADAALVMGFERVAFLDDRQVTVQAGLFPVLGPLASLESMKEEWPAAIAAVGDNRVRLALFHRLLQAGFKTPSVLHPSAVVSRNASVARSVFVAAGVVVNIGARIDDAAILNTGATIDHDCAIEAGAHISPGAHLAGNVTVEQCAWVGIGSALKNGVRIGAGATIGAGSAVVRDVPADITVAGSPARALAKRMDGSGHC